MPIANDVVKVDLSQITFNDQAVDSKQYSDSGELNPELVPLFQQITPACRSVIVTYEDLTTLRAKQLWQAFVERVLSLQLQLLVDARSQTIQDLAVDANLQGKLNSWFFDYFDFSSAVNVKNERRIYLAFSDFFALDFCSIYNYSKRISGNLKLGGMLAADDFKLVQLAALGLLDELKQNNGQFNFRLYKKLLAIAVRNGHLAVLHYLLGKINELAPNEITACFATALQLCTARRHVHIVRFLLLTKDFKPESFEFSEETLREALLKAVKNNHHPIMMCLLELINYSRADIFAAFCQARKLAFEKRKPVSAAILSHIMFGHDDPKSVVNVQEEQFDVESRSKFFLRKWQREFLTTQIDLTSMAEALTKISVRQAIQLLFSCCTSSQSDVIYRLYSQCHPQWFGEAEIPSPEAYFKIRGSNVFSLRGLAMLNYFLQIADADFSFLFKVEIFYWLVKIFEPAEIKYLLNVQVNFLANYCQIIEENPAEKIEDFPGGKLWQLVARMQVLPWTYLKETASFWQPPDFRSVFAYAVLCPQDHGPIDCMYSFSRDVNFKLTVTTTFNNFIGELSVSAKYENETFKVCLQNIMRLYLLTSVKAHKKFVTFTKLDLSNHPGLIANVLEALIDFYQQYPLGHLKAETLKLALKESDIEPENLSNVVDTDLLNMLGQPKHVVTQVLARSNNSNKLIALKRSLLCSRQKQFDGMIELDVLTTSKEGAEKKEESADSSLASLP